MSARKHVFIDAYGIERPDDDQGAVTGHELPATASVQGAVAPTPARMFRFDSPAHRTRLRGPHFDVSRIPPEQAATPVETNVIEVGADWGSNSVLVTTLLPSLPEPKSEREVPPVAPVVVPPKSVSPAATPPAVVPTPSAPIAPTPTVAEAPNIKSEPTEKVAAPLAQARTVVAAAEVEPESLFGQPFTPAWEVDRLEWPREVEQLFTTQRDYFSYAGKKLLDASREGLQTLAITSAHGGEGVTTLALCLARTAADAGLRVGLLDLNLRRPALSARLGLRFASDWQTTAAGKSPLSEAAIKSLEDELTVLPLYEQGESVVNSLGDEVVAKIIREAATGCELLILDAGQESLPEIAGLIDAVMVVRDIRTTTEQQTLSVATELKRCGIKAVGIAENFGDSQNQRAAA